ncbi:hypothetical protein [Streptomyces sp. NPDC003401]
MQQIRRVGLQAGRAGDVGAEVAAADTVESRGAVLAVGGNVGRFAADTVGDSDFAGDAPEVFGVRQGLGPPPDAVAVTVGPHPGVPLDSLTTAFPPRPVVRPRGGRPPVVHELPQHVDRQGRLDH